MIEKRKMNLKEKERERLQQKRYAALVNNSDAMIYEVSTRGMFIASDEISKKLEFEIKPIIGKYIKQQEAIYNMFYNAFNEMTSKKDNYHFSGKTNILKAPEFNDADKIRSIIDKLEDKDVISSIEEDSTGINVYIGEESKIDSDVTVIKTKYIVNGNEGTIAIIGPKRMEYDRVVSMLDYIKSNIEN